MTEHEQAFMEHYNKIVRAIKEILADDRLNDEQKIKVLGVIL